MLKGKREKDRGKKGERMRDEIKCGRRKRKKEKEMRKRKEVKRGVDISGTSASFSLCPSSPCLSLFLLLPA